MTAPSYTTDLAVVWDATNNTGWSELSGHTSGGADAYETDYYIQRSGCISQSTGVATAQTAGLEFDYGSNITISTGDCFFFWQIFLAPNAITSWATGGMRVVVGSSSGNVNHWNAVGNDFGRYPYGGWQNTAVDPTYTADGNDGTPAGTYRIFGSLPNIGSAVSKGNPHGVDAIRWGRGELIVEFGDLANGYVTFDGIAATNDSQNNRWGLFQEQGIVYLWKGLMSLGNTTNAVDMRDSNINITADDTPRTYAAFNRIAISNASSRVDWTGVSIAAANASQLSRGRFEMVDNADINFDTCTFTDMDTFIFQSNATVLDTTFRRCNLVTLGGGVYNGCLFARSTVAADASAAIWNTNADVDGKLDDTFWSKGTNAHHAIELGPNTPSSITVRGWEVVDFNASNGQNDSVIYNNSGKAITVNVVGNIGTISYKNGTSASTSIVANPVTFTVHVANTSGTDVSGARVWVPVTSSAGGRPYQASVTITSSGTTATVAHTGHGLATNDYVWISGANEQAYNGTFQITVTGVDAYTYTMATTATSPATGTITSTFVVISGTTDVNGVISASYTWSSDQPVSGRVRKASGTPHYKTAPVTGTIDSGAGLTVDVQVITDE